VGHADKIAAAWLRHYIQPWLASVFSIFSTSRSEWSA